MHVDILTMRDDRSSACTVVVSAPGCKLWRCFVEDPLMLSVVFSNDVSELGQEMLSHTELKKLVSIFKNIKVRDILC